MGHLPPSLANLQPTLGAQKLPVGPRQRSTSGQCHVISGPLLPNSESDATSPPSESANFQARQVSLENVSTCALFFRPSVPEGSQKTEVGGSFDEQRLQEWDYVGSDGQVWCL